MKEHFLCMDAICRREHYVAFPTKLDLEAHNASCHGSAQSNQIDMRLLMDDRSRGGGVAGGGGRGGVGVGRYDTHSSYFGEAPVPNFDNPPLDLLSGPSLQASAAMARISNANTDRQSSECNARKYAHAQRPRQNQDNT